jgi:UDP-3-O-[3-hydroxymyristoyl] glucosamine N-acyltransferase
LAAQVGIAGCVRIEDNAILWGQVGVASDVCIGAGAIVLGQCGVTKDLEGGVTYFGTPAEDVRVKYKELALIRKLPKIVEQLKK